MFDWFNKAASDESENRGALIVPATWVLLEVVGAIGLTSRKRKKVDPYCVVKVDGKEIHRTSTINDDGNPIWTVKTKALCALKVPDEVSSVVEDVTVAVMNGSTPLGTVKLSFRELVQGAGERREFPVSPEGSDNSILALRYRIATVDDLQFLGNIPGEKAQSEGLASDINFRNVKAKSFLQQYKKIQNKKEYFRVMPCPDPDRPEETEWMTRDEMVEEAYKPSKQWISAGDGATGRIYLEILRCEGLPKMDINLNDLTDAFVGIVFEDTMIRTDVIWDDLNPVWMPWTNRAFELRVQHPSSILMLGVFDYDEVPVDFHDPIGRVVISLANFRCSTDYTLHYKLHHDPRQEDDEPRGILVIRLRIEWEDESEAMKMSFKPAPRFIINVESDKSYRVLKYLTRGAVDMEQPSVSSVKLYAAELVSYWKDYCFLLDIIFEVLLWRGRIRVTKTLSVWFPMHSIALFAAAVLLLERPDFILPITLYGIAWILLSVNYHASRHPNPWKRVKKSEEINMMALFGWSKLGPDKIKVGQGVKEEALLDKLDKAKGERMSALITALLYTALGIYKVYSKTSLASVVMTTKTHDWSFLSGRLHYLHMMLKMICQYVRLGRNFVNWKSYSTDAFTTNCIMIATLWVIFPMNRIAHWTLRVLVWTLLGPWMKLVDIFWVHAWYETKDELIKRLKEEERYTPKLPDLDGALESQALVKMGHAGRVVAEDSYKLKDMREKLFGYFSETIPKADTSRFPSTPLATSFAEPSVSEHTNVDHAYHVLGQKLNGNMIHSRQRTDKPTLDSINEEVKKRQ